MTIYEPPIWLAVLAGICQIVFLTWVCWYCWRNPS